MEMQHEFDFSDYPIDHPLHSSVNKKVLGKFKDKMNGAIVEEFVGLRSKMYSILWTGGSVRTCKGINKSVNKLVHKCEMYKECLFNTTARMDKVMRIGSIDHNLYMSWVLFYMAVQQLATVAVNLKDSRAKLKRVGFAKQQIYSLMPNQGKYPVQIN